MAYGSQKPRGKKSALYGEIVVSNGRGSPVTIDREANPFDKAGFAPEALDPIIETLLDNADSGSRLLQQYTPMLAALMGRLNAGIEELLNVIPNAVEGVIPIPLETILDMAGKVSTILERVNRMQLHAVKAKDDAARLRAFIATGDDDIKGLEQLSESQLRKIVAEAAAGFADPESV